MQHAVSSMEILQDIGIFLGEQKCRNGRDTGLDTQYLNYDLDLEKSKIHPTWFLCVLKPQQKRYYMTTFSIYKKVSKSPLLRPLLRCFLGTSPLLIAFTKYTISGVTIDQNLIHWGHFLQGWVDYDTTCTLFNMFQVIDHHI